MKKRYIFAIPHEKAGYIVDARNPYTWEECGTVVLPMDATETDVMKAREIVEAWIMKRRNRRLNPIYWIIQYLGAGIGLLFMFFVPYLIEKIILGG